MSKIPECPACGCELLHPMDLYMVIVEDDNADRGPLFTMSIVGPPHLTDEQIITRVKQIIRADEEQDLKDGNLSSREDFWNADDPDVYWYVTTTEPTPFTE